MPSRCEPAPDLARSSCPINSKIYHSIADPAKHAGFKGHIKQIELADPFGGFDEIDAVAERAHG